MRDDDGREEDVRDDEALDGLISAAMDDALSPADHAALEARIAEEPAVAARVRAFHAVDAAVRGLAQAGLEGEASSTTGAAPRDLEAGLADLEARIGARSGGARSARLAPAALGLAAAAALALFLWGASGGAPEAGIGAEDDPVPRVVVVPELDPMLEEELSVALGYGDDLEAYDVLPDLPIEDFEVVDQLELLDFLSEQGWEGRG